MDKVTYYKDHIYKAASEDKYGKCQDFERDAKEISQNARKAMQLRGTNYYVF